MVCSTSTGLRSTSWLLRSSLGSSSGTGGLISIGSGLVALLDGLEPGPVANAARDIEDVVVANPVALEATLPCSWMVHQSDLGDEAAIGPRGPRTGQAVPEG